VPERAGRATALLAGVLLLAGAAAFAASPGAGPDEAFRDLKIAFYDSDWPAVLRDSETFLRRFAGSPLAAQVEFYRARALAGLPGRQPEATAAYRTFIQSHSGERERHLAEQAWSGLFSLACERSRRATPDCGATLSEGIASPSLYVSTLAAIRAADAADPAVRRRAVPILKRAYDSQTDAEIRNEILIALLKIDPREVPPPPAPPARRAEAPAAVSPPGAPPLPSLIRMTIYNKVSKRFDLKINLPVAFAQMLVDSLGEEERSALRNSARQKGVDLDDIFRAIQKNGQGRLVDMDAPDTRIELWIE
jgi:hypothetical protein